MPPEPHTPPPQTTAHRPGWSGRSGLEALAAFALGVLVTLIGVEFASRLRPDPAEADLAVLREVRDLIDREYVHGTGSEHLIDAALHGMLEDLDDYSRFYDREQSARLERETSGVYAGVGMAFVPGRSLAQVLFALPGSPADRGGMQPGDTLLQLNGESLSDLPQEEARRLLSDDGVELTLGLRRLDGSLHNVRLTPEAVDNPSLRHAHLLDEASGTAYLALTSFSRRTPAEFDAAMAELSELGMQRLVLDLRGNLGGVLDAALHVANRFIDEGELLITETRFGSDHHVARPDAARHKGLPLVVLVDRDSASSSEVLAGALQDHRVGVLVGERTYGKGTVQTLRRVSAVEGIVKLTTSLFRTPSGRLIERSLDGAWDAGLHVDVEAVLDDEAHTELRRFLARYSPPLEDHPAIRAWEQESGESLMPEPPMDGQLRTALDLLDGIRPGAVATAD